MYKRTRVCAPVTERPSLITARPAYPLKGKHSAIQLDRLGQRVVSLLDRKPSAGPENCCAHQHSAWHITNSANGIGLDHLTFYGEVTEYDLHCLKAPNA